VPVERLDRDGPVAPNASLLMPTRLLPFSFEGLPHLPAAALARGRLLARAVAGRGHAATGEAPHSWTAAVRGVGRLTVRLAAVDLVPWEAGETAGSGATRCRLALVRDGLRARLSMDPFFALALVRGVLGAPAPTVVRPLAGFERGVLGALVASALAGSGSGVTVAWEDVAMSGESVALNLIVKAWELTSPVRVDLPLPWLLDTRGALDEATASLLETQLTIELGRTELDREPWAGAEAGDAVLFAGLSPPAPDAAWPCWLRVGAQVAPGEVTADGKVRCRGPFTPNSEAAMNDDDHDDPGTAGAPARTPVAASAVLAEAPVEIVAEISRIAVRGDELLGLTRGAVLALGPRRPDVVSLRVGGREWARGELVTIDDQLGVRITELRRR
jgi:type III secretion system YscQ/HrcQ family protein